MLFAHGFLTRRCFQLVVARVFCVLQKQHARYRRTNTHNTHPVDQGASSLSKNGNFCYKLYVAIGSLLYVHTIAEPILVSKNYSKYFAEGEEAFLQPAFWDINLLTGRCEMRSSDLRSAE